LEDYLMAKKPTYEELEQRVKELEEEFLGGSAGERRKIPLVVGSVAGSYCYL
jgi:hypothetical protein